MVSRRDALRYGTAASALAGLGLASASAGAPEAAAAAPMLIDYAMRQIPAADIRAAGYAGVINYVSLSRPGSNFGAKPITRPYAESLTAAGLVIVSNYQYGKPGGTAPSDFTRGFAGGVADAKTAWQLHTAAGGAQGAPIFFSVDDDISRDTWNTLALRKMSLMASRAAFSATIFRLAMLDLASSPSRFAGTPLLSSVRWAATDSMRCRRKASASFFGTKT